MTIECACGLTYETVQGPCTDTNRQWRCLVDHTLRESYICPTCKSDNIPKLSDGVSFKVGMGVFNVGGLMKLDLWKE